MKPLNFMRKDISLSQRVTRLYLIIVVWAITACACLLYVYSQWNYQDNMYKQHAQLQAAARNYQHLVDTNRTLVAYQKNIQDFFEQNRTQNQQNSAIIQMLQTIIGLQSPHEKLREFSYTYPRFSLQWISPSLEHATQLFDKIQAIPGIMHASIIALHLTDEGVAYTIESTVSFDDLIDI